MPLTDERLREYAKQIISTEAKCIEWGAEAERSVELCVGELRKLASECSGEWKEITPQQIPQIGDIVLAHDADYWSVDVVHSFRPAYSAEAWRKAGWRYFRPIDPPQTITFNGAKLCRFCGQPMKPKGVRKRPDEYDHAHGCPYSRKRKVKS